MPTKKKSDKPKTKLYLGIAVIVIIILLAAVAILITQQPPTQQNQTKTVSVPTEIKSSGEAASLEQDTSSILKEVGDALNNIDASLPDV